ncbi:general transcription factor IIF subunit 1 [Aplysia californica]|uniref:Transcription initiation factor IIF subunit alpha n=1 Tax=Aplysia californica TaxID=6500 RepID=A0ABM1AG62_APLCA|nr:general transcription factor IIF subunit 1 [Aplysia californica]
MSSFQNSSSGAGPGPSSSAQEEFTVRIPRDGRKKFTMMKFGTGTAIDFAKMGEQSVKIERENNVKEYRTANDLDTLPKFGAGSEYGRDLKEESRRKKYGIMLKKYNPDDQPWLLKTGSGKQAKRYKGVREGGITENTSYYIFTKATDGAFEAYPVEEWYNFSPIVRYKYLNSEEAEEEYSKRDRTLNYFSIMLKKRYRKEEDNVDDDGDEKKKGGKGGKRKSKGLILTDMEDWDDLEVSDDDGDDDSDGEKDDDTDGKPQKKKKPKPGAKKKKSKNAKQNSDDEAIEESDEGDYDDREVDYMSDSGSSSSFSGPEDEGKGNKYDEKGVDQEAGLRNILDSEAEDEEEEETQKEEPEEEPAEKEGEKKEEKKKGADDSSSSSSEDDSDIEKDAKLASELFLQGQKKIKKEKKDKTDAGSAEAGVKTDPSQPNDKQKERGLKRKPEKSSDGKSPSVKKHKSDDSDGISEDAIRRYLMRKPMTTKDLLQKFKSKKLNMTNERITTVIVQLLKKINPDKKTINKKLYLSLKKPE